MNWVKDFICKAVIICAFGFNGILTERWIVGGDSLLIVFFKCIPLFVAGSIAVEIYASHRDKWHK